ncbi:MAG: hypothetical protein ACPGTU_15905 [Myxococcota bacterium]
MRIVCALTLFSLSCASDTSKSSGGDTSDDHKDDVDSPWTLVSDEVEGGVLLSVWSDGDTIRMVGGDLGGGSGVMVHGDASSLCVETDITERALWWIHGDAPGSWTAVGETGTVLRETDGVQSRMDIPTEATLFGVWMDGDTTWAAGGFVGSGENRGEIWRHDGTDWTQVAADLPHVLFKVWENWFVGQDIAYRWNGDSLDEYPIDGRILTMRGNAEDDAWAVGGLVGPIVLHWDGSTFNEVDTAGLGQAINGVYTDASEEVWLAGNYGVTARWTDEGWQQPDLPLTVDHLHAVWRHGDATWWVGGDLFNAGDNHGTIIRYSEDGQSPSIDICTD